MPSEITQGYIEEVMKSGFIIALLEEFGPDDIRQIMQAAKKRAITQGHIEEVMKAGMLHLESAAKFIEEEAHAARASLPTPPIVPADGFMRFDGPLHLYLVVPPHIADTKCPVPCDCGAHTSNTPHATWCSSLKV